MTRLTDVADMASFNLHTVYYPGAEPESRFVTTFKNADTKSSIGGMVAVKTDSDEPLWVVGYGATIDASWADYARQIRGQVLVTAGASGKVFREFKVPETLTI